jgi:F-type H+-transporting ATPase subunit b
MAPAAIPVKAHAQEAAAAVQHEGDIQPGNPAPAETKKSQEEQEEAFLNAPMVHKIADLMHVQEPTARVILLLINFAIIFFAIAIPLSRLMPKLFRKRSQGLRYNLDEARKASDEARKRMSAVEEKLAGLDREIASFRAQVEQESLEDEKRIKASLKEESERVVASAEQEINAAAAHVRRSLKNFAADLAVENAARQLKMTPETDRALINDFIGQISNEAAGNGAPAVAGKGGSK